MKEKEEQEKIPLSWGRNEPAGFRLLLPERQAMAKQGQSKAMMRHGHVQYKYLQACPPRLDARRIIHTADELVQIGGCRSEPLFGSNHPGCLRCNAQLACEGDNGGAPPKEATRDIAKTNNWQPSMKGIRRKLRPRSHNCCDVLVDLARSA